MKLLGNMLGAEIDFVILGIDSKSRSVVASRREAMMRKRQLFYFSPDANGEYRVREGRVVQARVIAVADKSIRVEIFGVECSIMARDLKDGYDVLDKLYDDNDLNCDNFAQAVREYHCSREVITAVANLYLRQQIMIDTY